MHQVITSICVISQKDGEYKEQLDYDMAEVYLKNMTDEEIEKWIDEGKPYDKAALRKSKNSRESEKSFNFYKTGIKGRSSCGTIENDFTGKV